MTDRSIEAWLMAATRLHIREFATQLRAAQNGALVVPGLDWTVTDLGQHVACLPAFWRAQDEAGDQFERPENFAAYSDKARVHIDETEAATLAQRIEAEFDRFLAELVESAGQRWLYGIETTGSNMCGLILNESILHGGDLTRLTGAAPPRFERREANVAVDAILLTAPCFIDPHRADKQPDGVYAVRFRGGHDYTWTKRGGELIIERGWSKSADARLNADPAIFLLTSLGHISQARAALSGAMVAYGRRPWRFLGLGSMTIDGV